MFSPISCKSPLTFCKPVRCRRPLFSMWSSLLHQQSSLLLLHRRPTPLFLRPPQLNQYLFSVSFITAAAPSAVLAHYVLRSSDHVFPFISLNVDSLTTYYMCFIWSSFISIYSETWTLLPLFSCLMFQSTLFPSLLCSISPIVSPTSSCPLKYWLVCSEFFFISSISRINSSYILSWRGNPLSVSSTSSENAYECLSVSAIFPFSLPAPRH